MKYLFYFLVIFLLLTSLYLWDASLRNQNIAVCPTAKEIKAFNSSNPTGYSLKKIYQAHFFDPDWHFPRKNVNKIKMVKNIPVIGRFIKRTLTEKQQLHLLKYLNNPDNFTWKKPNLLHSDAEYIFYFYDEKNKVIGKLWLCISCGQLIADPFSPNMKYGYLKNSKKEI